MRILLVNKFHAQRGGAERCYFDQARWLRSAGHDVHCFSQRSADDEPADDSSSFVEAVAFRRGVGRSLLGVGRFFWSETVRRALASFIERVRPDVALLHNVYHHLGPVVPATLHELGVPSIMILHDHKPGCPAYSAWRDGSACYECRDQSFHRAFVNSCGGSMVHGAILSAESYWQWRALGTYGQIGAFLAPSDYLRRALADFGFPYPIAQLRNAVDLPTAPPAPWSERAAIGFAGRLSIEKGVDVLVRSAARLPKLNFRIVGDGPARRELEELSRARSLSNVAFLGQLSSAALQRETATWRLAIVPSLSPENLPYAALDAMNHEVPVIASALGGLPELLADRGVLVPPGDIDALADAIGELYPDVERLRDLAARARTFIDVECRPRSYVPRLLGYIDVVRRQTL